jgi:hypothetical protein
LEKGLVQVFRELEELALLVVVPFPRVLPFLAVKHRIGYRTFALVDWLFRIFRMFAPCTPLLVWDKHSN